MEVHFSPETEEKLRNLAAQSGCESTDELVRDVVESYVDELARTRATIDSRYDEMKSGRLQPVSAEAAKSHFQKKSEAARRSQRDS